MNYSATSGRYNQLYANSLYPLVTIGDITKRLQYGSSSLATAEPNGLPMLRMNNLQDDGWSLADLKYIELSETEAETYRLEPGDLLFNRTNSKELVGKCAVFRESGHWVFASYLIRVSLDSQKALPEYVSDFLSTRAGRAQIDRVSRQIVGMSNINAEEIRQLQLPLPPLDVQRGLIKRMQTARDSRAEKLRDADALLSSMDTFLMDSLGLKPPPSDQRTTFAVQLSNLLKSGRLDVLSHRPIYTQGYTPDVPTLPLSQLAHIDSNIVVHPTDDSDLVPYIGLPECDLTEVREVTKRPYSEVRGRSIVKPGNILFARIEPSVFNKKYIFAENLRGHEYAYTSTEFYVVDPDTSLVNPYFLYSLFFCSFVFAQVRGKTTGSSGRRRLDRALFADLLIPVPNREVQDKIALEVTRRRDEARHLRTVAAEDWVAAKTDFEHSLLGGVGAT